MPFVISHQRFDVLFEVATRKVVAANDKARFLWTEEGRSLAVFSDMIESEARRHVEGEAGFTTTLATT